MKKEFTLEGIQKLTADNKDKAIQKAIRDVEYWIKYQAKRGRSVLNTDDIPFLTFQAVSRHFVALGFEVESSYHDITIRWKEVD